MADRPLTGAAARFGVFRKGAPALTSRALLAGCVFGMFLCVVNVMVALKTGLGFGGAQVVALFGFIWLSATGSYCRAENNVIQAAASGSYLSMFALDSAVAACYIFRGELIPLPLLFALTLMAVLLGIWLAGLWRRPFIEEAALPYPTGTAVAELINSLAEVGSRQFRAVVSGAVVGFGLSLALQLRVLPGVLPGGLTGWPTFLGLSLSPLVFGMGYIVGHRAALMMGVGSLVSWGVWLWAEQGRQVTFSVHLTNPWVMSCGTAIMFTSAVFILWQNRRTFAAMFRRPRRTVGSGDGPVPVATRGTALSQPVVAALLLLATALALVCLNRSPLLLLGALPVLVVMGLVASVFCARAAGETGMVPATSLGVITFIVAAPFIRDWVTVLFLGAFVAATGLATITMMNTFRAGAILETDRRSLVWGQVIGAVAGVLVGTVSIYAMGRIYGFGTEELPAPVSIAWGTMVEALSQGRLPPSINPVIALATAAVALMVHLGGLSAIALGIGVFIPPAYSCTMLAGALYRLALGRKRRGEEADRAQKRVAGGQSLASGLIVGEGICALVCLLARLLTD